MRNPYATASAYRETEVLSAPPGRLVVITFDGLLVSLARARAGMVMSSHEITIGAIDKSRGLLCQLLVSLDRERGGEIAARLFSVYLFVLGELLELSLQPDVARLDRTVSLIRELRDAFNQIASQPRSQVS
ncbi:MAG: flagellar export chaperone FliS [Gemmatimonadales bacterium]